MNLVIHRGKLCVEALLIDAFRDSCLSTSSNWTADRVMQKFPDFMNKDSDSTETILFTGEMVSKLSLVHAHHLSLDQALDVMAQG